MKISNDSFFKITFNVVEFFKNELIDLNNAFLKSALSFLIVANFICIMIPILFLIIYFSVNSNSTFEILFSTRIGKSLETLITKIYSWLICTQFVLLIVKNYLKKLYQ